MPEKRPVPKGLTPWVKGQSGNPAGRPKGSRQKIANEFLDAMYADFQKYGQATIEQVRVRDPVAYVKVVAAILPSEMHVKVTDDLSDAELDDRIRLLATAIGIEIRASGIAGGEKAAIRQEQVIDLSPLPEADGVPLPGGDEAGTPADGGQPGREVGVFGGGDSDTSNGALP